MEHDEKKEDGFVGDHVRDVVKMVNGLLGVSLVNSATVPDLRFGLPRIAPSSRLDREALHSAFHAVHENDEQTGEIPEALIPLHELIKQFADRERPAAVTAHTLCGIAVGVHPEKLDPDFRAWIHDDARLGRLFTAIGAYIRAILIQPTVEAVQGAVEDLMYGQLFSDPSSVTTVSRMLAGVPDEQKNAVLGRFRAGVLREATVPTHERLNEIFAAAVKN